MVVQGRSDHWNEHARRWSHIGPPLRPCPEDVAVMEDYLRARSPIYPGGIHALLLGVTPELALMDWPRNASLLAVDRNSAMVEGVWPRSGLNIDAEAVCGDWMALPCADGSRQVVLGDGCLTLLPSRDGYRRFFREMHRVLAGDGRFLIRHFIRPDRPERIEDLFADLLAGGIGNFHVFKWRLAMAMHGSLDEGVVVGDIWEAWRGRGIAPEQLASDLGWPLAAISTIDNYRGSAMRYTFPNAGEVAELSADCFDVESRHTPGYELGERCPTFILAPKGRGA